MDTAGRKENGTNSFGSSDDVVLVKERKQAPSSLRLADVACRLGMLRNVLIYSQLRCGFPHSAHPVYHRVLRRL